MKRAGKKQSIRMLGWFLVSIIILIILIYFLLLTTATMHGLVLADFDLWTIPRIIRRTVQLDILFLLLVLAICLSAHKKIVVLYLRKFRLNTNIISPNNKGGLGNRVRIITLQDESFPSMASTAKEKLMTYLTTFGIFISAILLTYLIYYLVTESDLVVSENNYYLSGAIYLIIAYATWLCISLLIFISFYILIRNKNKVIQISKPLDINIATNKVISLNLFIKRLSFLGSRSTVVETVNNLWKETVSALICKCNVAIIDISQLTDNIIWEIKECSSNDIPMILIYSEETKSQLVSSLNQLSLHVNVESLSNIPTVEFSIDNQLVEFRNKLISIITENYIYPRKHFQIKSYHLKRSLIYLCLFLLSSALAYLITSIVGYNIFETLTN